MSREELQEVSIAALIQTGAIVGHKDGNHGSQYPRADEFGTEGVPFLTAKSLLDGRIDIEGAPRLAEERSNKLRIGFVKPGDVLLSHNATVGRVAVVPEFSGQLLIGTSLTYFRLDQSKIEPRFLAAYFSGKHFQDQLSGFMSQTTRNQVPITAQRYLRVLLPPIEEQRAIASILGPLDDKIELNRRMNATMETMARAIFKDWFVDFGPTRAKMAGKTPYLSPDLWSLFSDRLNVDGKPEGWISGNLCDVAELHTRSIAPSSYSDELFAHFSLPAYDAGQIPSIDEGKTILSNKTVIPADAVLLSKLNPEIFRVWLPAKPENERQICSTEFLVFTAKNTVGRSYLYCLFGSDEFRAVMRGMVTGTSKSHQRVNPRSLAECAIRKPTGKIAMAFEALVGPKLEMSLQKKAQSHTLAALRNLLLPKLMSGEIRIKDAEKIVGGTV